VYDRPCGGYEVGRGGGGGRVGREVSCEVCHDPGGGPDSRGRFWSGPTSIITIHTDSQATTASDAMDGGRALRLLTGAQRTQRRCELDGRSSAPKGRTG
jgi:hypothetical protein